MTNHPNRAGVYELFRTDGHTVIIKARGRKAALAYAIEYAGADNDVSEDDLRRHWGVRIFRLTAAEARARGF